MTRIFCDHCKKDMTNNPPGDYCGTTPNYKVSLVVKVNTKFGTAIPADLCPTCARYILDHSEAPPLPAK